MLSGRRDGDGPRSTARVIERLGLHLIDDIPARLVRYLAENDVFTVKMRGLEEGDEELGAYNHYWHG